MGLARRFRGVWRYLTASRRRLEAAAPEELDSPVLPLAILSVGWGLVTLGIWEAVWRLTWPHLLHWIYPAAACAAALVLGPYRRACVSLARSLAPRGWRWRHLCWPALGVWAFACYHSLGWKTEDWPSQLASWLAWLWPRAMYRVVLLAPLWGAWAMLVTVLYHRPTPATDAPTRRFARGVSATATAAALATPLAATLVGLMYVSPALRFLPPAAAVVAAAVGGWLLVRRHGGLCREVLLGCNVLTQLVFLSTAAVVMP